MNRINRYLEALPASEADRILSRLKDKNIEAVAEMTDAQIRAYVHYVLMEEVAKTINEQFSNNFFLCSTYEFDEKYLAIAKRISNENI